MIKMVKNFLNSAAILLAVFLGLSTTPAYANQTGNLLPINDGTYLQWTPKTGTIHYAMVDETTCNGTTDYNSTTTINNRDSYGISLTSVPDGATITQIDITPCASKALSGGSNSTLNVFYRLNGIDSSNSGSYFLSGTTPTLLTTSSYTGLTTIKSTTTTLETGAVLTAGSKGARLGQILTKVTYTPLATPSGLSAAANDSSSTILNWLDNSSNEDGFKIERSDNGGAFNEIATVAQNVRTYENSGLTPGVYVYRVRAYNTGGNSGYSGSAAATILAGPSSLTAAANGSLISLSWTDNSINEDGFKIEIATNGGQFVQFKTVTASTSSYIDTRSAPATYSYRIRAYKGNNNSDFSNTADAIVLAAPTGLYTSVAGSDATLNWLDNSTGEDGFRIERKMGAGSFAEIDTVGAGITTYLDAGLSAGVYTYRVRAYKSINASNYSASASATIL